MAMSLPCGRVLCNLFQTRWFATYSPEKTVVVAMGSNQPSIFGDREKSLREGLKMIHQSCGKVIDTSFLYETPPSLVQDQPMFLNAACTIKTKLAPRDLLGALKKIEKDVGRNHSSIRYGPRPIDLDIIFYGETVVNDEDLIIPHPRLVERDFVLKPVMDMCPDFIHPVYGRSVRTFWDELPSTNVQKVFPSGRYEHLWKLRSKTHVMGIVNATPDSFSGDGLIGKENDWIKSMLDQVQKQISDGADIIDIGAHSTKPTYHFVSADEESRIMVKAIQAIRESGIQIPISVDTFRSNVASAALDAGANIINDVWGTLADPRMRFVAAEKKAPIIVMHNSTIMDPNIHREVNGSALITESADDFKKRSTSYAGIHLEHAVQEVGKSLDNIIQLVMQECVPRWSIIVDPGLGFGKSVSNNLELIGGIRDLKNMLWHMPVLLGPSRKSFIGKVLDIDSPNDRIEGTIACAVLGSERGAEFIRVHDVKQVKRALKVSDSILLGNKISV